MKANFETLLTQSSSGVTVNSLLAAKNFGVKQEHILVGNAKQLITYLIKHMEGRFGFIRANYKCYADYYDTERCIFFKPPEDDLRYTAEDIMEYFGDKELAALILVNPDNLSGNYLSKADVLRLLEWSRQRNIKFILEESLVDFAEEPNATMICEEDLARYDKMIVVKDISKSYGIPGIGIGVMASANEELIASLQRTDALCSINSFGEFYMQITEKYQKDYEISLDKIKEVRRIFMQELKKNTSLKVFPSQANYVMAEIVNGMTAGELTRRLLIKHNMFIKDLSGKVKMRNRQFVCLAVRSAEDNEKLLEALRGELDENNIL